MTRRQESLWLAAFLGAWFAVNLGTLARSPTIWRDEVMFTEPAVRFLAGLGFTVTSWPATAGTPAVLNGPLYSLLLVPWLWLWGVGPTAARSLGLVLSGLSALLLWRLARGTGAVRSAVWRLVGIVVFLCGSGVAWGYRSGRYDPLGLLLVVALVGAVWRRSGGVAPGAQSPEHATPRVGGNASPAKPWSGPSLETVAVVVIGVALPFAGLHLVPYCALLVLGVVLLGGRGWLRRVGPALVGAGAGCVLLGALHWRLGTWAVTADFIASQRPPLAERVAGLPSALCADPGLPPLLGLLACWLPVFRGRPGRWPVLAGLLGGTMIPACMALAGRYPPYYGWMAFLPTLCAVLYVLDRRTWAAGPARWGRSVPAWCGGLALALAAGIGLPLRLAACALEWRQRDYAAVERFIAASVQPEDIAITTSEAYYAAARHCREVMLPAGTFRSDGTTAERATVLIAGGDFREDAGSPDEEAWVRVASYASPAYSWPLRLGHARWYELSVWRRR